MNQTSELFQRVNEDKTKREIAYFTMEVALENDLPSYSGGLGVLAGDTLRSAADLGVPVVAVTLLQQYGYFHQELNEDGTQDETEVRWQPDEKLKPLPNYIELKIEERRVRVCVWEYDIVGKHGFVVPVYFLDVNVDANDEKDRELNRHLYGGGLYVRLCQEIILGIGGVRMLRDLGYRNIESYHLNEGHASLLTLELIRASGYSSYEKIKKYCIFTTHTPVAAGHDVFEFDMVKRVMSPVYTDYLREILEGENPVNLTTISLKLSRFINGVSVKHAEVSRNMFKRSDIVAVTNGVHSRSWTAKEMQALFDEHLSGWDNDPAHLTRAVFLPDEQVWQAHQSAKSRLLKVVEQKSGVRMDPERLTIGFARRAAAYKRADLIFTDIERLLAIGKGRIQIVFAGKAHPKDTEGKAVIRRVFAAIKKLRGELDIVYLENYGMDLGALITAGVDVWLNNPRRPLEASGTSGMKAAHNGVPNFSVLDGWWIEGCLEGVTGWGIGPTPSEGALASYDESQDLDSLYDKLGRVILPLFCEDRAAWVTIMKNAIALNASYFNTHRMVREYAELAYNVHPLFQ